MIPRSSACSDKIEELRRNQDSYSCWQQDVARGGSKRAKAGEIVNRSIILNPILLQDTHQRPIDLGVSSSYLRDELEGYRGACCRTSSLPTIAFFRSGFALHPADCVRLPQPVADAELALVLRASELFHEPEDHIEEESVIDDAMYVLRALCTSNRHFSALGSAASAMVDRNARTRTRPQTTKGGRMRYKRKQILFTIDRTRHGWKNPSACSSLLNTAPTHVLLRIVRNSGATPSKSTVNWDKAFMGGT
jgi:hypothetical protein